MPRLLGTALRWYVRHNRYRLLDCPGKRRWARKGAFTFGDTAFWFVNAQGPNYPLETGFCGVE